MANPYHKGFDPAVQAARVKTARAIDLFGAVDRAATERKSNLEWFRSNVQQLVEDFQFAPHLDTCSWLSSVAKAAARLLPVSYDRGPLCPKLRGQPVDVLSTFIVIGAVEKLDQKRAKTSCLHQRHEVPDGLGRRGRRLMLRTMVHESIGI